jgi:hypothetical protein
LIVFVHRAASTSRFRHFAISRFLDDPQDISEEIAKTRKRNTVLGSER